MSMRSCGFGAFAVGMCLLVVRASAGAEATQEKGTTPPTPASEAPHWGAVPLAASEDPHLLLERLMFATVAKQDEEIARLRQKIIFEHPQSLPARFLVATLNRKNAEKDNYRAFLDGLLKQHGKDPALDFGEQYCQALVLGAECGDVQTLAENKFALKSIVVAQACRHADAERLARALFRAPSEDEQRIAVLAITPGMPAPLRIAGLHVIDDETARWCEQFLCQRLDAATAQTPQILQIRAEDDLKDGEFAAALPRIEALLAKRPSAQALFWRAWCQLALRQPPRALAELEELRKQDPEDSWWKQPGQAMRQSLLAQDKLLDQYSARLHEVLTQWFRPENDLLQGHFVYHSLKTGDTRIYLGVDFSSGSLQAGMERQGKPLLAYSEQEGRTRLYFEREPVIHAYRRRNVYLEAKMQVSRNADGTFSMQWNCQFSDRPASLRDLKKSLADSAVLTSAAFLRDFLARNLNRGWFPMNVGTLAHQEQQFWWTRPKIDAPTFENMFYTISSDARHLTIKTDSLECHDLELGSSAATRLAGPVWPKLPERVEESFDGPGMMRLLGWLLELFGQEVGKGAGQAPGRPT